MKFEDLRVYLSVKSDSTFRKDELKRQLRSLGVVYSPTLENVNMIVFHKGSPDTLRHAQERSIPVTSPSWVQSCHFQKRCLPIQMYQPMNTEQKSVGYTADKNEQQMTRTPPRPPQTLLDSETGTPSPPKTTNPMRTLPSQVDALREPKQGNVPRGLKRSTLAKASPGSIAFISRNTGTESVTSSADAQGVRASLNSLSSPLAAIFQSQFNSSDKSPKNTPTLTPLLGTTASELVGLSQNAKEVQKEVTSKKKFQSARDEQGNHTAVETTTKNKTNSKTKRSVKCKSPGTNSQNPSDENARKRTSKQGISSSDATEPNSKKVNKSSSEKASKLTKNEISKHVILISGTDTDPLIPIVQTLGGQLVEDPFLLSQTPIISTSGPPTKTFTKASNRGAVLARVSCPAPTILVTPARTLRTMKVVYAYATALPIVRVAWLYASLCEGALVDPTPYHTVAYLKHRARLATSLPGGGARKTVPELSQLFAGYSGFISLHSLSGDIKEPTKPQLAHLLEKCGMHCLEDMEEFCGIKQSSKKVCFICHDKADASVVALPKHCLVVSPKWVMDCIEQCQVLPVSQK